MTNQKSHVGVVVVVVVVVDGVGVVQLFTAVVDVGEAGGAFFRFPKTNFSSDSSKTISSQASR